MSGDKPYMNGVSLLGVKHLSKKPGFLAQKLGFDGLTSSEFLGALAIVDFTVSSTADGVNSFDVLARSLAFLLLLQVSNWNQIGLA